MVFSSSIFLFYFLPIFLLLYYVVNAKYKNIVILFSSILFYAWGAPNFIFVLLGTTFIDFHLVKWMDSAQSQRKRRLILTMSVSINLGLLFYFKYCNFFIENVNSLLSVFGSSNLKWTQLALPIGISFYTFETITYVVDVFRKVHKPLKNFWDYQLYIILFPKLIAGPIVRYNEIKDDIVDRSANENWDMRLSGFFRFIIGLSKKLLIANTLGSTVDEIFMLQPAQMSTGMAWIGIIAYSFQIYFDFSGYSDMAIGIARMIGFKFPENFDNPYISRNITEFWRRWHMSLGRWMKSYLYIPLGGNKVKFKARVYFNLWVVFFLSGLWHGAAWNFVAWGVFHGLFLVLDRLFLIKLTEKSGKFPAIIFTYFVTLIGWVIFRSETLGFAFGYIEKMFSFTGTESFVYFNYKFWFFLIIGGIFAFFTIIKPGLKLEQWTFFKTHNRFEIIPVMMITLILLFICAGTIAIGGFNPFIYFRF
jgi:alginate O-acetyltransferase complex protein AlgI